MIPRKIAGLRWYIALLLCLASGLNYFDRQTLSVLAHTIQDELKLTTAQYADITSAFLLSYTIMYAVCGRLVDRLGTRRSFTMFVTGWSVANLLHGLAQTAAHFMGFRFLLGATEAAHFPAGIRAVTEWFPMRDRAMAVGIFNAGTAVGAALAAPIVSWLALTWGWRFAFVAGGVLGLLWVAVWAVIYHLPRQHRWLGAEELNVIESGAPPEAAGTPAKTIPLRQLLGMREVWGCVLARAFTDPISFFFVFWTPKYLQEARGFDLAAIGKYSWIPFAVLALGNIAGGWIPTALMRRGWSHNRARKTVMGVATAMIPVCCIAVTRVPGPAMALALISVAMFFHAAWQNITLPAEVFPSHVVGSVTGLGGAVGGLCGVLSQQAIGWTVQNQSYTPVFLGMMVLYPLAFAAVCLLIRQLGRERTFAT